MSKHRISWSSIGLIVQQALSLAGFLFLAAAALASFYVGATASGLVYVLALVCSLWMVDHVNGHFERRELRDRVDHLRWRVEVGRDRAQFLAARVEDLRAERVQR